MRTADQWERSLEIGEARPIRFARTFPNEQKGTPGKCWSFFEMFSRLFLGWSPGNTLVFVAFSDLSMDGMVSLGGRP